MRIADVIACLSRLAPPEYADDGDPIGLQIGSPAGRVTKALVCVTVDAEAIAKARRARAQLIVAHHPLIYHPLRTMASESYPTEEVSKLLRAGVAVFVAHTNLDVAPGGVNDALAAALGLKQTQPLRLQVMRHLRKLVVFVPEDDLDPVRRAICDAGAGRLGDYSGCTFRVSGTGTFTPGQDARPAVGAVGRAEQVRECRLETIVPGAQVEAVVRALVAAHPYQEPAYDVYPLESYRVAVGHGRIGRLPRAISAEGFLRRLRRKLRPQALRVHGKTTGPVRTVGLCAGAGDDLAEDARRQGADVFVTGEIRYHAAAALSARGMLIAAAGHLETEQPVVSALAEHLQTHLAGLHVIT